MLDGLGGIIEVFEEKIGRRSGQVRVTGMPGAYGYGTDVAGSCTGHVVLRIPNYENLFAGEGAPCSLGSTARCQGRELRSVLVVASISAKRKMVVKAGHFELVNGHSFDVAGKEAEKNVVSCGECRKKGLDARKGLNVFGADQLLSDGAVGVDDRGDQFVVRRDAVHGEDLPKNSGVGAAGERDRLGGDGFSRNVPHSLPDRRASSTVYPKQGAVNVKKKQPHLSQGGIVKEAFLCQLGRKGVVQNLTDNGEIVTSVFSFADGGTGRGPVVIGFESRFPLGDTMSRES